MGTPFLDSIETPTQNEEEVTGEDVPSVNEEDFEDHELDDPEVSVVKRINKRMNKRIRAMRKWAIGLMRKRIARIKRNSRLSWRRKMKLIRRAKRICKRTISHWTKVLKNFYRNIAKRIQRRRCLRRCRKRRFFKAICRRRCRRKY